MDFPGSWDSMRYLLFDIPLVDLDIVFESRYKMLLECDAGDDSTHCMGSLDSLSHHC